MNINKVYTMYYYYSTATWWLTNLYEHFFLNWLHNDISVDRRKGNQPPQVEDKLTLTEDELIEPKVPKCVAEDEFDVDKCKFCFLGMK